MSDTTRSADTPKRPPTANKILDGSGNACVDLTPRIKHAISPMEQGEILEVWKPLEQLQRTLTRRSLRGR